MAFVKEAAMMPIREIPTEELMKMNDMSKLREVNIEDLKKATKII